MSAFPGAASARTLLLGAALLSTGGCGYKTPPVPPATVVPNAIEDLRASMETEHVRLSWSYPLQTIRGTDIEQISSFDLFRAEIPLEEYCPTCPIPFVEPIEVDGGLTMVDGKRRVATYDYDLLRPGHKYFFKVQSRNNWWASSADSNIVTFVWHVPGAAPTGLSGSAADSKVELSWQPVTTLRDGEPVQTEVLYQVLRKTAGEGFANLGSPVADTAFVDHKVVNGREYSYQVQSVLRFGEDLVYGESSETMTVTPIDTTPPPPPEGVMVVATGQGLRVLWEPSAAEDVAGYHVYRRSGSGSFELIATVEVPSSSYVDTSTGEDDYFIYAVTAFDSSARANESTKSAEAAPRY